MPWVFVRTQRHILAHTHANIDGDLSQYVGKQADMTSETALSQAAYLAILYSASLG